MNKDSRLIFEAYRKKLLSEAPPAYALGDLDIPGERLKSAPGGGYGLKKKQRKSKDRLKLLPKNW